VEQSPIARGTEVPIGKKKIGLRDNPCRGLAMLYETFADYLRRVETTSKRLEMTDHLTELLEKVPNEEIDKVCYMAMGRIHPAYRGDEIGVAEKLAMKAISRVSGKGEEEVAESYRESGDLGKTMERLLSKKTQRTLDGERLTVVRVYNTLDKMSKTSGKGAQEIKIRLLAGLLTDASPIEARYILRTVLGRLRLGIAEMTLLDALAIVYGDGKDSRPKIERAYNLCSDIGYVAKTLAEEGMKGIEGSKVTVGMPVKLQMAERLKEIDDIMEKLDGKCAAEYKYDGIRIQAHVSPDEITLFSRRQENITSQFPDVVRALRKHVTAGTAVLDGECVPVDINTGDLLPFQVVSQRRGRKYDLDKMVEEVPVVLFLFDCLLLDGDDLTREDYLTRTDRLKGAFEESEHLKMADRLVSDDPSEIEDYFEKAINEGTEGLICKSVASNSAYQAGKRGWMWIKWKRSYRSEMADTVDLVVVGAFAGRGRRAGTYGALLMAAYNQELARFETACKLGTGFTDEELAELPGLLDPLTLPKKDRSVEALVEPDVWVEPEVVLEVNGDEITLSPVHSCAFDSIREGSGLAIRFPRMVRMRDDRGPEDATTVKELVELYKRQLKQVS